MDDPRAAFSLAPAVHHLNHGSFGAVTRVVQLEQTRLRQRMEEDTMRFFTEEVLPGLDRARGELARFLGADPADLVFVRNATEGVAAVLGSLTFEAEDEILVNDHEYRACIKACLRTGARVRTAEIPLPLTDPGEVVERILSQLNARTRLVLISHVTSPTGLVFPLTTLLDELAARGVPALVDGAHAPGMLELELAELARRGLAYYTANLHKWVCAPKGSAFLWAAPSRQPTLLPPVTSHGHGTVWPGRTAFQTRFDWTGTQDPSPFMLVPHALAALSDLHPDGLSGVLDSNRQLALAARRVLQDALHLEPLAPESMIGSLASVRLPDDPGPARAHPLAMSSLQARLHHEGFRVPVSDWPRAPQRLLRVSAHRYNRLEEYEALAERLLTLLAAEGG